MYSANNLANYILCYYNRKNKWISNLKLQKIFYFLQAQFLVSRGVSLIDEPIKAVDWGPMVESVYYNYNIFGSASIPVLSEEKYPHYIAEEDAVLISEMLDQLEKYTATTLLRIIHNQKPWKMAYCNGRNISNADLLNFFKD